MVCGMRDDDCYAREGLMQHKAWRSTPKVEEVEYIARL